MSDDFKINLSEDEIPQQWYNVIPDLVTPLPPPLGPDGNPAPPEAFTPIFPMALIQQEMSSERWIGSEISVGRFHNNFCAGYLIPGYRHA